MLTIALLIYKSKRWLDFCLDSLNEAKNETPFNILVVANDPFPEIEADPRVSYIHRNPDPEEHYLARVYRAWNKAVEIADTEHVCLVNSDMYFADGWVDALMRHADGLTLPTSLLVESGRIPSAFGEYVRDFGRTPDEFDKEAFKQHAELLKSNSTQAGRLFMPVVFHRQTFMDLGGYPEGNVKVNNHYIVSGDQFLFDRYLNKGYNWITVNDSIVYHAIEGEMRDNEQ